MSDTKPVSVLFVCLGNICRSPTAHGVFEKLVKDAGLQEQIYIDSCGTGDWHIGHPPDERSAQKAKAIGYPIDHLRARQACTNDFYTFDYILAMDADNLRNLSAWEPADHNATVDLFLRYSSMGEPSRSTNESRSNFEVPDPYFGGEDGFIAVADMIVEASTQLLEIIKRKHLNG